MASKSILELCLPIRTEQTKNLFEKCNTFQFHTEGFFDKGSLMSGLVVSEVDANHLVQQAALSASYLNRRVLVVMGGGRWGSRPATFHKLPCMTPHLMDNIKFLYPNTLQEVVDHLVELDDDLVPDTIIVQHLDKLLPRNTTTSENDPCLSDNILLVNFVSFIKEFLQEKETNPGPETKPSDHYGHKRELYGQSVLVECSAGSDSKPSKTSKLVEKEIMSSSQKKEDLLNLKLTEAEDCNNIHYIGQDTGGTIHYVKEIADREIKNDIHVEDKENRENIYEKKMKDINTENSSEINYLTKSKENIEDSSSKLQHKEDFKLLTLGQGEKELAQDNAVEKKKAEGEKEEKTINGVPELLCFGRFPSLQSEVGHLRCWWKEIWLLEANKDDFIVTSLSTELKVSVKYQLKDLQYWVKNISVVR